MENSIQLLPEHISNQIAAGEVIQRPASVIKELVENAIDSGAANIEVHILQAGKTSIQVIDDGCGMNPMDARLAFERHATSKIRRVEDLFALHTKGFRGEALPSIASIAHVRLTTKRIEDELGTLIVNEGGKIKQQEPIVCKNGTSFEVKNLFFNVPARRNFLKSDKRESQHILEEFLRVALIHYSIGFSFYEDSKCVYQLPKGNQRKRIVDLYGRSMNDKLVPVSSDSAIAKISGFIVKPEFAKKTKGEQYFFVNQRFFKDNYLHHAIMKAFDSLIPNKTYPGYFLNFEIDPAEIDVNVHPTKTEIKFENQRDIYSVLNSAVKESLGKFNIFPSMDFDAETSFELPYELSHQPVVEPRIRVNPDYNPFSKPASSGNSMGKTDSDYANKSLQKLGFGQNSFSSADWQNFYTIEDETPPISTEISFEEESRILNFENVPILLLQAVALLSKEGKIWVFDLAGVKEKLVFDQFFQTFLTRPISSQQLLFPIEKTIDPREERMWQENEKTIQRLGFQWKITDNLLEVFAAPNGIEAERVSQTVQDVSDLLMSENFDKSELARLLIQTIATSNSRNLNWTEKSAKGMLNEWAHCEDKWKSPSGKLLVKTYSPNELLK